MHQQGYRQAASLQRLPTPTEQDIKALEEKERRRREAQAKAVAAAGGVGSRGHQQEALRQSLQQQPPGFRSTRSTASFNSRDGGDGGDGGPSAAQPAGAQQAVVAGPKRPANVPRLNLGALVAAAAGQLPLSLVKGAAGCLSAIGAVGAAREQVPLEPQDRQTLEALLSGRLSPGSPAGNSRRLTAPGGAQAGRATPVSGAGGSGRVSARGSLAGGRPCCSSSSGGSGLVISSSGGSGSPGRRFGSSGSGCGGGGLVGPPTLGGADGSSGIGGWGAASRLASSSGQQLDTSSCGGGRGGAAITTLGFGLPPSEHLLAAAQASSSGPLHRAAKLVELSGGPGSSAVEEGLALHRLVESLESAAGREAASSPAGPSRSRLLASADGWTGPARYVLSPRRK